MESKPLPDSEYWVMHFDGSKMKEGAGAGIVLQAPTTEKLSYVLQIHFNASNNMAEYGALLHGLHMAKEIGVKRLLCFGDSDLVVQQLDGTWDTKSPVLAEYRRTVDDFGRCFAGLEVRHIKRDDNEAADALARLGSQQSPVPPDVSLKYLHKPYIKDDTEGLASAKQAAAIFLVPSGMFFQYLHRPTVQGGDEDSPLVVESAAVFLVNPDWTDRKSVV